METLVDDHVTYELISKNVTAKSRIWVFKIWLSWNNLDGDLIVSD